jgi:hypothetical protein
MPASKKRKEKFHFIDASRETPEHPDIRLDTRSQCTGSPWGRTPARSRRRGRSPRP